MKSELAQASIVHHDIPLPSMVTLTVGKIQSEITFHSIRGALTDRCTGVNLPVRRGILVNMTNVQNQVIESSSAHHRVIEVNRMLVSLRMWPKLRRFRYSLRVIFLDQK